MVAPEIAIADSNTLSCMGLQSLLEEIIPMAVIRVFLSLIHISEPTRTDGRYPRYVRALFRFSTDIF